MAGCICHLPDCKKHSIKTLKCAFMWVTQVAETQAHLTQQGEGATQAGEAEARELGLHGRVHGDLDNDQVGPPPQRFL